MTTTHLHSASICGIEAQRSCVEIAVSISSTLELVAHSRGARETLDRVDAALRACGIQLPDARYVLNLRPSWSAGTQRHYDLPAAVAALAAAGGIDTGRINSYLLAGELGFDGALYPVRGAVILASAAKEMGLAGIILPAANAGEAAVVDGLDVRGAETLAGALQFLAREGDLPHAEACPPSEAGAYPDADLADVKGQEHVKRVLEVAAAGSHNVLMVGPPGSGKSMLARRLMSILPAMTFDEALEATKVHSVAALQWSQAGILRDRPLRTPHSSISDVVLTGGGVIPWPGEASLAHNGVLLLDEMPGFRHNVLESLLAPLDDGRVTLSRQGVNTTYPARFMLVATMSPCPCGYWGDNERGCTCTPRRVHDHLKRVPAALLARLDLRVDVPRVRYRDLADLRKGEPSATIRERVARARAVQRERYSGRTDVTANAHMSPADVAQHCAISDGCAALLRTAITRLDLSARAYYGVLKIARTVADLDRRGDIATVHLSEAIQYYHRLAMAPRSAAP